MKRNTALKWTAWLTIFAVVVFSPLGQELYLHTLASVAHQKYAFPVPATEAELQQFVQTQPDAKLLTLLIVFGIMAAVSMLIAAILVALFGDAKPTKPTT